jgi:1-acyl-sn-glycerol-3-phosphate acyltransferase
MPFHAALFQSAIDAEVPVRCLALSYHQADGSVSFTPAYIGDISLWQCLWAIAQSRGLQARLRSLAVLETRHVDRRQLARQAHQSVAHGLATNRAEFLAGLQPGRNKADMMG